MGTLETTNYSYELGAGDDLLEVSGALWNTDSVKEQVFFGGDGDDTLIGVIQAIGDDGNDTIISASTGISVSIRLRYSSNQAEFSYQLQVLAAAMAMMSSMPLNRLGLADIAGGWIRTISRVRQTTM